MTKNVHSALAAVTDAGSENMRSDHSGPPGPIKVGFAPIKLTEQAACAPDPEISDFLARVSKGVTSVKGQAGIVAWLGKKFGAERIAATPIFTSGSHKLGSGIFVVGGNADVTVEGEGVVLAVGDAKVIARGDFDVYAGDRVKLIAYGEVQVFATGKASVRAESGRVRGFAGGETAGVLHDRAMFTLTGNARFDVRDYAAVHAGEDAVVRLYGRSRIDATGRARATLYDKTSGWLKGDATADLWGETMAYAADLDNVKVRGGEARLALLQGRPRPMFSLADWRAR